MRTEFKSTAASLGSKWPLSALLVTRKAAPHRGDLLITVTSFHPHFFFGGHLSFPVLERSLDRPVQTGRKRVKKRD